MRRFVEVAARIHRSGIKYLIVESEPFLKSFSYFTRAREAASIHELVSFHVPWQAAISRRLIGPICYWLKLLSIAFLLIRTVRAKDASLVLAPGETLPEVITARLAARITRRPGAVVVQSDPFLEVQRYNPKGFTSFYAAYRTLYNPLVAFIESFTAQLHIRAMNKMTLLVVGGSLSQTLASRGIMGVANVTVSDGVDLKMIDDTQPSDLHYDAVLVGRIDLSKGVIELLDAWAGLGDGQKPLRLAVVGPVQEALERKMETFASSSRGKIHNLGPVSDRDVISILKPSGVLVLPSYFESYSLVVAEALGCSMPVVCYDSPGIREFFPTPAVSTVPKGDAEALVDRVRRILSDEEERSRLGRIGRKFVSRYSWNIIAASEARIYQLVAAGMLNLRSEKELTKLNGPP